MWPPENLPPAEVDFRAATPPRRGTCSAGSRDDARDMVAEMVEADLARLQQGEPAMIGERGGTRVLVTGAGELVGPHLVDKPSPHRRRRRRIDRHLERRRIHRSLGPLAAFDVCDAAAVGEAIARWRPTTISSISPASPRRRSPPPTRTQPGRCTSTARATSRARSSPTPRPAGCSRSARASSTARRREPASRSTSARNYAAVRRIFATKAGRPTWRWGRCSRRPQMRALPGRSTAPAAARARISHHSRLRHAGGADRGRSSSRRPSGSAISTPSATFSTSPTSSTPTP